MTTGELAAAIAGLGSLPPAERYKTAKRLIEASKGTLSAVLAAAAAEGMADGRARGATVAGTAREFGVTRDALYKAAARSDFPAVPLDSV